MVRRIGAPGRPRQVAGAARRASWPPAKEPTASWSFLRGLQEAPQGPAAGDDAAGWPDDCRAKLDEQRRRRGAIAASALAVTFGDTPAFDDAARRRSRDAKVASTPAARTRRRSLAAQGRRNCRRSCTRSSADPTLRGDGHPRPGRLRRPEDAGASSWRCTPRSLAAEKRDAAGNAGRRAPPTRKALLDAVGDEEGRRRRTCRPTSSASCATSTTRPRQAIEQVWGIVRDTPAEQAKLIAELQDAARRAAQVDEPDLRSAGPSSPRPARSATRSSAPAARSAPTSPARTGQPRLPAGEHPRPQRRHRQGVRRDVIDAERRPRRHRHRQGARRQTALTRRDRQRDADRSPRTRSTTRRPSDKSMMPDDLLKPLSEARGPRRWSPTCTARRRCRCWRRPDNAKDSLQRQGPDRLGRRPEAVEGRERRDRRQDARAEAERVPAQRA